MAIIYTKNYDSWAWSVFYRPLLTFRLYPINMFGVILQESTTRLKINNQVIKIKVLAQNTKLKTTNGSIVHLSLL